MSDVSRKIGTVEINAQTKAQRERAPWSETSHVRLFGHSPFATALQIRGTLKVPSHPPAYACALLSDEDLLWLYRAIETRLVERGLGMAIGHDPAESAEP